MLHYGFEVNLECLSVALSLIQCCALIYNSDKFDKLYKVEMVLESNAVTDSER